MKYVFLLVVLMVGCSTPWAAKYTSTITCPGYKATGVDVMMMGPQSTTFRVEHTDRTVEMVSTLGCVVKIGD